MTAVDQQQLQKVAEGREAEMFAWEDGAILRLLRDAKAQQQAQWEAAAMKAASDRGVRVPVVHSLTKVMGRPGLIMERIEGPDLLTLIGRQPWTVFKAARVSGEVQARLHEVVAPSGMPPVRGLLEAAIRDSGSLPNNLRDFALTELAALPDGDRLCHGDFHPANILMAGDEPVLIDWTNATRGDPAADVARTRLMLSIGDLPPGTSTPLRALARVGRTILVRLYLRSYRRQRPLDMEVVRRWEVPIAAARLAEGIQEEVPRLWAFLTEREQAHNG